MHSSCFVSNAQLLTGHSGTVISDPLQEHFLGRRRAIFVAGIITVISIIGAAIAQTTFQLLGCRIVTGLALGTKASVGESSVAVGGIHGGQNRER
jgi:MFS family permease